MGEFHKVLRKVYHSKYFPRLFYTKPDGGAKSGVTGYFLIEWKVAFSIGILRFNKGSRESFHSHAFNALTWWICGAATEKRLMDEPNVYKYSWKEYKRSWKPKYTPKENIHIVLAHTKSWAFTVRGPWKDTWNEYLDGEKITMTHGRKIV